jgi:hypothetical protein
MTIAEPIITDGGARRISIMNSTKNGAGRLSEKNGVGVSSKIKKINKKIAKMGANEIPLVSTGIQASPGDFSGVDLVNDQYRPIWNTHSGIVSPKHLNSDEQIGLYGLDRNLVVGNQFMKDLQRATTPNQSPNQSPN